MKKVALNVSSKALMCLSLVSLTLGAWSASVDAEAGTAAAPYTCYDAKHPDCSGTCPTQTPKCQPDNISKTCICNP